MSSSAFDTVPRKATPDIVVVGPIGGSRPRLGGLPAAAPWPLAAANWPILSRATAIGRARAIYRP